MPPEILTPALLFGAGLVAGLLNVIAGGGSLLTLPILIFLGLPPTVANGTNRVAIFVQNVGATTSFHRKNLLSAAWLRLGIPPALAGALLGTWAAVRVGDVAFQRVLVFVLLFAAGWTIWNPTRAPTVGDSAPPAGRRAWIFRAVFFSVGVYGGFIQAGVGFIILAATSAGGLDLVRGNAVKVALVLAFTVLALGLFALNGMVDWTLGLTLAVGNVLGALLGVRLQVLKGHRWVRGVVTATVVVFAARLLVVGP